MDTPDLQPMDLPAILQRIEQRLNALNLTANVASQRAGKPDAIRNIRRAVRDNRRGGVTVTTLAALAPVLQTSPGWLLTGAPDISTNTDTAAAERGSPYVKTANRSTAQPSSSLDSPPLRSDSIHAAARLIETRRQLMPVFGAAEGGSGALILSKDPVEFREIPSYLANSVDAYGVYIVGESMVPRYEPGEIAEVAPHHPYRRGDDVLLYRVNGDGDERVCLKRLVGWTDAEWQVEQFNPPERFALPRAEWPTVHVVRGRGPRSG